MGDVIKTKKGNWSVEEDQKIFDHVKHAQEIGEDVDWSLLASSLLGRNKIQCERRYQKLMLKKNKENHKKGGWTTEEDQKIIEHVNKVGDFKWFVVASFLPGRLPKQCSNRYKKLQLKKGISKETPTRKSKEKTTEIEMLSAGISHVNMTTNDDDAANITAISKKKGNWSVEEDQKILNHVKDKEQNGEDIDWVLLASTVSGRNKNQCERRYNKLMLKNKKEEMKKGGRMEEEDNESSEKASSD